MVSALAQPRRGEQALFVKLDSWHTLALPLFRRAFPSVPWVFLYRDPVEVPVSQLEAAGIQTDPTLQVAHVLGTDTPFEPHRREDYVPASLPASAGRCSRIVAKAAAG